MVGRVENERPEQIELAIEDAEDCEARWQDADDRARCSINVDLGRFMPMMKVFAIGPRPQIANPTTIARKATMLGLGSGRIGPVIVGRIAGESAGEEHAHDGES